MNLHQDLGEYLNSITREPPLTATEEKELARRIQSGDTLARTEFIKANIRLVIATVKKMKWITKMELKDLCQEGMFGLLKAVDRFDPTYGTRFSTFAVPWIQQSIRRASLSYSSSVRLPTKAAEDKRKLNKLSAEMYVEKGDSDLGILAQQLNWSRKRTELLDSQNSPIISLDSCEDEWDIPSSSSLPDEIIDPLNWADNNRIDQWNTIDGALKNLSNWERIILNLRFGKVDSDEVLYKCLSQVKDQMEREGKDTTRLHPEIFSDDEMTLRQIGEILGYKRETIRQMEEKILSIIRKSVVVEDYISLSAQWEKWKTQYPICKKYITGVPKRMGLLFRSLLANEYIGHSALLKTSNMREDKFVKKIVWMINKNLLVSKEVDGEIWYLLTEDGKLLLGSLQEFWSNVEKNKEKYNWRDKRRKQ